MNYRYFTFLALLLFSVFGYSQDDGYDIKVRKMLEVSGASSNFKDIVFSLVENQSELLSTEDQEYYELFKSEILEIGEDKLLSKYSPIYRKYLSEKELDAIIEFYQTDAGKKLISSMPKIIEDAVYMGEEWAEEIRFEVEKRMQEIKVERFNTILEEDCSYFKEGTFSEMRSDTLNDNNFKYERKGGIQVEEVDGEKTSFRVTWLSECRYSLELLDEHGEVTKDPKLIINIFEVKENSYKYIGKMDGVEFYMDGQLIKER